MLEVASEELRAGLVVPGGYRLDRVVGEGGMGVVWSATKGEERFALKFLRTDRTEDQKNIKRMIREARAAAAVEHPNVARIVEVGELDNGLPFIVMELLEGETLAERLRRVGKLEPEEAARILAQTASAIEAAQAAGIVHRDLKPDNVFLVDDVVKVLDFGIAKTLAPGEAEESATSLTTTGAMIGTAYYMAPEQIFGDEDIDGRADVWALGVMLYECLSGKRPTQAPGVGQVIKLITTNRIAPLAKAVPGAPPDLAAITMRSLARAREDRPTVAEIRHVLERHLRGERPLRRRWFVLAGALVLGGGATIFAFAHTPVEVRDAGTVAAEPDAGAVPMDVFAPPIAPDASIALAPADAQTPIATFVPRKALDAGRTAGDAAPDVFDIPLENVRK